MSSCSWGEFVFCFGRSHPSAWQWRQNASRRVKITVWYIHAVILTPFDANPILKIFCRQSRTWVKTRLNTSSKFSSSEKYIFWNISTEKTRLNISSKFSSFDDSKGKVDYWYICKFMKTFDYKGSCADFCSETNCFDVKGWGHHWEKEKMYSN